MMDSRRHLLELATADLALETVELSCPDLSPDLAAAAAEKLCNEWIAAVRKVWGDNPPPVETDSVKSVQESEKSQ